ncbi:hypothetical protein U1Q18_013501 [Sarracenia purpurea var. burkii]
MTGFTEVNKGCCGTGLYEIGTACNETSTVCLDSSKYVFWDAAHPSEKSYELARSRWGVHGQKGDEIGGLGGYGRFLGKRLLDAKGWGGLTKDSDRVTEGWRKKR